METQNFSNGLITQLVAAAFRVPLVGIDGVVEPIDQTMHRSFEPVKLYVSDLGVVEIKTNGLISIWNEREVLALLNEPGHEPWLYIHFSSLRGFSLPQKAKPLKRKHATH